MIDEFKETIWEIVLACLVGAFFGLVVAQFLPNRESFCWNDRRSLLAGCLLSLRAVGRST